MNQPNITIEKLSLQRVGDFYEAAIESGKEWFAEAMIFKPQPSLEEIEQATKNLLGNWEKDQAYTFNILDASANQVVGFVILNHINRTHEIANLGYAVRTSRVGQGIASEAARLVARYGFENLGFQRIEIVVRKENQRSLRVAERVGAVWEGLLRNRLQVNGSVCDAYMHSLIPSDFGIHKKV